MNVYGSNVGGVNVILLLWRLGMLIGQRDEIEGNDCIPRTRSDLFSGEKHEMAVNAAAKLREMDKEIESLSTREPLYSTDSDDAVSCPAHDDSLVTMSREVVHTAIHRAVALCEYVDTILQQAIQHVQRDEKESYCEEDTLKSPQNNMTYEERYAAFRSDSSSSSISTHEHTVDMATASAEDMHTKIEHVSPSIGHKHNLLHSDSSGSDVDTPVAENSREFRLVKITPLVQSVSLEEDVTTTPIIELNQTPTRINSFPHQYFHEQEQNTEEQQNDKEQSITEEQNDLEKNIAVKQNVEDDEEKQTVEEKEDNEEKRKVEEDLRHEENIDEQSNRVKENAEEYSDTVTVPTGTDEQASEGDDNVGELLPINGEIKINVVPTRQDDGSLSPEPSSYSKLLVSSKGTKKDDTLDGKIFGSIHTHMLHQSDSLPSFTSHGKLIDPDSISLVINQCTDEDMEHSDEDILIAHSMDSTSFIDELLDSASLDSTSNFSQESRSNLVFPNSPVALRHNKESIVRRRYDAGRFDETSPVKEEEKNGFEEFAELFEQTFQLSRSQRERSSSPHSNKVASVFVFEGSHDDENAKVSIVEGHTPCCEFNCHVNVKPLL